MTAAERAYTSDYSYVAPSTYARDFAQQLPKTGTDNRDRAYGKNSRKAGKIELLPEKKAARNKSLQLTVANVPPLSEAAGVRI